MYDWYANESLILVTANAISNGFISLINCKLKHVTRDILPVNMCALPRTALKTKSRSHSDKVYNHLYGLSGFNRTTFGTTNIYFFSLCVNIINLV